MKNNNFNALIYSSVLFLSIIFVNAQNSPGTANLIHQWTFDDGTAKDSIGNVNGILVDGATISNKALDTSNGGYLSFDAAKLALNSYPALTMEVWFTSISGANTGNTMLSYFGNTTGSFGTNYIFMASSNRDSSRTAISCLDSISPWEVENEVASINRDDGNLHHMVSVLTSTGITVYIDGINQGTTIYTGKNAISGIGNQYAYLAKSGYTADPTWKGKIHKFSIYNKGLTGNEVLNLFQKGVESNTGTQPEIDISVTSLPFDSINNYNTFTIVGIGLTDSIRIKVPTGISVTPKTLSALGGTVTTKYLGNILINDSITFTSDSIVKKILVTATANPSLINYLTHQWTFADGTTNDVVGNANGILRGSAIVENNALKTGKTGYLELPAKDIAISTYPELSMEVWFRSVYKANNYFTMICYFGDVVYTNSVPDYTYVGYHGCFIATSRFDNISRAAISCGTTMTPWLEESMVNSSQYNDSILHHMISTITDKAITFYVDGKLIGTTDLSENNKIKNLSDNYAFLAQSGYVGHDSIWNGTIYKFSLYNKALTENEVQYLYQHGTTDIKSTMISVKSFTGDPGDLHNRPKWNPTFINFNKGDSIIISASGTVNDGGGYSAGPNGTGIGGDPVFAFPDWYNDISHIALIGRLKLNDSTYLPVRNEIEPYTTGIYGSGFVGSQFKMQVAQACTLELSVNDGDSQNNSGEFTALIAKSSSIPYNVSVPVGTKACYIAGEMNGWTPQVMTKVDSTHYTINISGASISQLYKYCSGPNWNYVELNADGSETTDRNYSENDVVAKWKAVYDNLPVSTTYNVSVPVGTKACYIAGEMNGWTLQVMTEVDSTHYTINILGAKTSQLYKYCSGPYWNYVELNADGSKASNRNYSANDVVAKWNAVYDYSTVYMTYNVSVPTGTKVCYLSYDMNNWGFTQMTETDETHYTITLISSTSCGYKYCSGPGWGYQELDASGNTIPNRTYSANDVVASWTGVYDPSIATGYDEIAGNDNSAILYPNPATDGFYIETGKKSMTISVYNLNGTIILTRQVTGNDFVNISSLPKGMYIVKLTTTEGTTERKMMKE
jgi:hypothetical protein